MIVCHLVILGTQGKLEGQCYERERRQKHRRVDGELQPTGEYRDELIYEKGTPNKEQKNRLGQILFGDY